VADQDNIGGQQEETAQISGTVKIVHQSGDQAKPQDGRGPGQVEEEAPEKKSKRKTIAIVVVVILVVLAGLFYWHSTYTEDTDDAQVDGDLYQVSSRVVGQVIKVYVEDNQVVHQGDPIADIDPRDLQVALAQAEANLANAQAEYAQARSNVPITAVNVRTNVSTSGSDVLGSQASVLQAQQQELAATARIAQAKANAVKAQLDAAGAERGYVEAAVRRGCGPGPSDRGGGAGSREERVGGAGECAGLAAESVVFQRPGAAEQAEWPGTDSGAGSSC
jgi:membrane fusion protein (multidrug efflux system)